MKENYCFKSVSTTSFESVHEKVCIFENKCSNKEIEVYFHKKNDCFYFFNMPIKQYAKIFISSGSVYNVVVYNEDGFVIADHSIQMSPSLVSILSNIEDEKTRTRYVISDILSTIMNHPIFNNSFKNNDFISFIFNGSFVISSIFKLKKHNAFYYEVTLKRSKSGGFSKIIIEEINGELAYTLIDGVNSPSWLSSLNKTLLHYFDMKKISLMLTESGKIKFLIDGLKFNSDFFYDQKNHCLSGNVIEYHNGYASDKVYYTFNLEKSFDKCGREIFDALSNSFLYKHPNATTMEKLIELGVYDKGDTLENNYITLLEMLEY